MCIRDRRYIGIDVSKATFVVAYSSDKGGEIRTFNNTTTGIKQFICLLYTSRAAQGDDILAG